MTGLTRPPRTRRRRRLAYSLVTWLLVAATAAPNLERQVAAADVSKDAQVSMGIPTLWTLEQAHYLLLRQRMGNIDLLPGRPGEQDLNPNALHGSRLDLLRTFFGAEASFDQSVGRSNQLSTEDRRRSLARAASAGAALEALQAEELALVRQIGALRIEAARLPAEGTQLAAKTAEIGALDSELAVVRSRLATAQSAAVADPAATEFKNVGLPDIASGDAGLVTDVVKKVLDGDAQFANEPRLHASTVLDNYVQMQYELIAKQLSLLRDDVGVDNRLVFVELPHTIYIPDTRANRDRLVQSWWRVRQYHEQYDLTVPAVRRAFARYLLGRGHELKKWPEGVVNAVPSRLDRFRALYGNHPKVGQLWEVTKRNEAEFEKALLTFLASGTVNGTAPFVIRPFTQRDVARRTAPLSANDKVADWPADDPEPPAPSTDLCSMTPDQREVLQLFEVHRSGSLLRAVCIGDADRRAEDKSPRRVSEPKADAAEGQATDQERRGNAGNLSTTTTSNDLAIRAVDLVPRQSALNVNAVHDRQVGLDIGFGLQWITGFGAKTRYQRQREQFEQFVHQDVFASGFGRGRPEFGWAFGPLPGRRHVTSGSKVTYAALIVPRSALAITLEGFGCALKRKAARPERWTDATEACDLSAADQVATVKIPGELEGFSVDEIRFQATPPGEVATLTLHGSYFSPQVGVLINGVPLKRPLGIAQVELNKGIVDPLTAPGPVGELEFVNQQTLILRLRMDKAYEGTPRITLVTPQRVGDLNHEPLRRVGQQPCPREECTLASDDSLRVFVAGLSISSVLNSSQARSGTFTAHVSGSGVGARAVSISLNGADCERRSSSASRATVTCLATPDPTWTFEAIRGGETSEFAVPNPLLLKDGAKGEVLFVTAATGGTKARVGLRLPYPHFNPQYDSVEVIAGGQLRGEVGGTTSHISLDVEPSGSQIDIKVSRRIDSLGLPRVMNFSFVRQTKAGEWMAKP